MITQFRDKYRFLSNFWPAQVRVPLCVYGETVEFVVLPTVEHAYQASKAGAWIAFALAAGVELAEYCAMTPGQAKRLGREIRLPEGWDEVRLEIMRFLLLQKFAPGDELARQLTKTDNHILIEGNRWHDNFWGICFCGECPSKGQNQLGELLMEIRRELHDQANT